MNYRKKPVVIEARQLTAESLFSVMRWIDSDGGRVIEWCWDRDDCQPLPERYVIIETLEGQIRASEGDWIIKGVAGEFYPCKPAIFAATYEPVEDAESTSRSTPSDHLAVMRQALEALENCTSEYGHRCNRCDSEVDEGGKVAAALRAALAQQAEPTLTIERLRDALVASRIIPPEAR